MSKFRDHLLNSFAIYSGLKYDPELDDVILEQNSEKEFTFVIHSILNFKTFKNLLWATKNSKIAKENKFNFIVKNYVYESLEFREYLLNIIPALIKKIPKVAELIKKNSSALVLNPNNGTYIIKHESDISEEEITEARNIIKNDMIRYGFKDFQIDFQLVETINSFNHIEEHDKELQKYIKELNQKEVNIQKTNSYSSNFYNSNNNSNFRFNKFSKNTYNHVTIKEMSTFSELETNKKVHFEGEIYRQEIRRLGNVYVAKYSLTDYKDTITVSHYLGEDKNNATIYKVGQFILVDGLLQINRYGFDLNKNVRSDKIIVGDNPYHNVTLDNSIEKRIELSARTKMNTMDGILSATDLVEIAKKHGHKAVAILDSNSVQAFPEFTQAAKKNGIKPIYGVSFDIIEKGNNIILGDFDPSININDAEFVVFDIETTHLSPRIGELIEFGATVIKNGEIVNKSQFFVKAKKPLSAFTTNLTGITQQMIDSQGIQLDDALDKIYELFNNKIAVAHNAKFDMNFLIQKFLEANRELPKTTYIDTLMISRIIFEDKKKHSLGEFCKNFDVIYDTEVAHRADYDAEVLASAFKNSIFWFVDNNVVTLSELNEFTRDEKLFYSKLNTTFNQYSVIALNNDGLKEIFQMISKTLTERFWNSPKMFFDDLPKSKNILIGSNGLRGELIDKLLYSNDIELEKIIERCDYIEIPAPQTLSHKWSGKDDFSKEEIEGLLKHLVNKAKSLNKMVVAIGDVRYETKEDAIFFKSLVYSKGIGNTSHFLFDYRKKDSLQIPTLNYLTTEEMIHQFSFLGHLDLVKEIVVETPNKIADMVDDNIVVTREKLYTPKFDNSNVKLKELVYSNAHKKYGEKLPEIVELRIKQELEPILKYGFDVVYWISHILVKKSEENGYIVGSRGSVGSSFVATMAEITEVNPLPPHYICDNCKYFELVKNPPTPSGYDLDDKMCEKCNILMDKDGNSIPFETFLGFQADKVPDIDLNFSSEYQGFIHDYIKELFGEYHTFRAGTISTIKDKTAFGYIKKANEEFNFGYTNSYIDFLSYKIEGVKRTTGQHPGGIIIVPKEFDVEYFTPINYPADDTSLNWKTTHLNFESIHDNLLKLDILGHRDPTAIAMLSKMTGVNVKTDIPKKDPRVMSLFYSTKELGIQPSEIGDEPTGAVGLPEFGTNFVRKMLKDANPRTFSDLISISGLSHGTNVWKGNAETLIKEQNMSVSDVISCRDDIMLILIKKGLDPLFSFKVMEKVRKGKGLSPEEQSELKKNNIPEWMIKSMLMIEYMFPKAHATAYVIMAWRIAWFKLYKPLEYYSTYLSIRVSEFDIKVIVDDFKAVKINEKINEINKLKDKKKLDEDLLVTLEIAREIYARGYKISNIDLMKSKADEWIIDYENNALIPPFTSVKGLGLAAAQKLVQAREERPFISKEDFKLRSGVNKTITNVLDELGVLKDLTETNQMSLFTL
ncbi:PolC-type DNA polymerase III [Mycoplasma sp. CSL7491-lung]|uniref:PolC-type DNA polymerase III n=1 Tax=Mycoplasma sp. CSL7491-lung TaxID=549718 RepID=UPI001C105EC4|nr:PolC-type DNA polymerase III [Mycoplasma sp. CSL7491-lung]MBU4693219.1 PolC-type DNA polymerase III [Mycoplasma sp. CSL7491-lung]